MLESDYWIAKLLFQRGLALTYLIAFTAAYRQFRPLAGENGLLPFNEFFDMINFSDSPSLFYLKPSDKLVKAASAAGVLLSFLAVLGVTEMFGTFISIASWLALWLLYLSFVNAGQLFYGYGWESMLLEAGFIAVFLGGLKVAPSLLIILAIRWMLFRVMFGAGLIKLRGDDCWKDLSCLNYHYETQPMPNPLSWFFHNLSETWHRFETLATHFVQLFVPLLYFTPQPVAAIAGGLTILYHVALMLGGNYSWLNWLTIVLAFSTFSDSVIKGILPVKVPALASIGPVHGFLIAGYALVVVALSYYPIRNMLSSSQSMNASFDPLHLVNTYGAFGSITERRYEVVIEATDDKNLEDAEWEEYRFYGKPTELSQLPRQYAPYHLRLEWQMWFAAMTPRPRRRWFRRLLHALLEGDEKVLSLFREVPFEQPEHVRARRYLYSFTDTEERKETGNWWKRELVNEYYPPISRQEE